MHIAVQDDGPYRVSLTDSGMAIAIEAPFGGHKVEWPERRTEIRISIDEWPAIVAAVEKNFAEAKKQATEHNKLDRMFGNED